MPSLLSYLLGLSLGFILGFVLGLMAQGSIAEDMIEKMIVCVDKQHLTATQCAFLVGALTEDAR